MQGTVYYVLMSLKMEKHDPSKINGHLKTMLDYISLNYFQQLGKTDKSLV